MMACRLHGALLLLDAYYQSDISEQTLAKLELKS